MDALALVEAGRESSVQRKTVDDKSDSLLTETVYVTQGHRFMRNPLEEFGAVPKADHGPDGGAA